LPHEDLLYFADSAFAPYGSRPKHEITERTLAIAEFLLRHGAKAIVVACNTATAAAIKALRARYPELSLVGVEPGLKPAVALTQSKVVGVLATERTLSSTKFATLRDDLAAASGVQFVSQACIGLVDRIERGELQSMETMILVKRYVEPLLEAGADTLVLGCTHYPFVRPLIERVAGASDRSVAIVDTGDAVARQLARLLARHGLTRSCHQVGALRAFTTGSAGILASAFDRLLGLQPQVTRITPKATSETAKQA